MTRSRLSGILTAIAAIPLLVGGSAARADAIDDEAVAAFQAAAATICIEDGTAAAPEVYDLTYREDYEGATDTAFRLYKFDCGSGAYNHFDIFFGWTELDGVQPIAFAVPTFEPNCTYGGFENLDCVAVSDIAVTGMSTVNQLVNVQWDPAAQTLTENACWRGVCDASDIGVWQFRHGQFVLVTYDVDASYNGEIDLIRIVDYPLTDAAAATAAPAKGVK
jgi:hypothetical protein